MGSDGSLCLVESIWRISDGVGWWVCFVVICAAEAVSHYLQQDRGVRGSIGLMGLMGFAPGPDTSISSVENGTVLGTLSIINNWP
jgi:hypothetical protein